MTISRYILLRMRNVLEKKVQRKSKHTFYIQYLFSKNRAVYEIISKNMVEPEGPQMTSEHSAYELHAG
jgi:hypothetical protein